MKKNTHVNEIFAVWEKTTPQPKTELVYSNPFELLVAVILSAQTTDKRVNIVTKELFQLANNPKSMLALGEEQLINYIKSLGLFRIKARNIINTCSILHNKLYDKIPTTRKELEKLPGVGRKTANVILNTLLQEPVIGVDTHVIRVSNRLKLSFSNNPKQIEYDLIELIPIKYHLYAHHWLILHGRYICKVRPLCAKCNVSNFCSYKDKF